MTRKVLLIASVATLALSAPASGERGGNRDRESHAQASQQDGERKAERAERQQRAEQPQRTERQQRAERPQRAERQQRTENPQRAERPQRFERQSIERAERPQRVERQRVQRAERPQRVERQRVERVERQQRVERQRVERAEQPQRIERQRVERAERQQRAERQRVQRAEHPQRIERQRIERADHQQRAERQRIERAERQPRIDRQRVEQAERLQRVERQRFDRADRRSEEPFDRREAFFRDAGTDFDRRDFENSIRPMKFKADQRIIAVGDRIDPVRFTGVVPTTYRTRYVDTPDYYYRYDDDLGYLYRIDRDDDFVRATIPLFGGYGIGDPWPNMYYSSYVPLGYRNYYYDTPDYYYRYDGYGIYQIDAGTQLISALVALLTGQGYGVGQMLPANYGVYNVPFGYRSTYFDRDDAYYRYGDGFIYQVDPYSRLVEARYPLYSDAYLIGDPWPVAYPDYNVPLGYQSLYYDTPDYHYRYANGGIYQVDPTTQLITALVALVSGQQFGIGQQLPPAYTAYNVPLAYRDRYFDTDDDWYRYADGYIYRVDPYSGMIEEALPVYA